MDACELSRLAKQLAAERNACAGYRNVWRYKMMVCVVSSIHKANTASVTVHKHTDEQAHLPSATGDDRIVSSTPV
jgi:hypothetical protein